MKIALDSPFHPGELAVQARLGVRDDVEPWAHLALRPAMPEQHRRFYAQLPFMVAAARDERGRPWATLLAGRPGFARSPDPGRLVLETQPVPGDALEGALRPGGDLGLLGIELHTRRRNRVNGRMGVGDDASVVLEVDQSFGNCPQYITERTWRWVDPPFPAAAPHRHLRLDAALAERIRQADTLFIATGHRGEGDDARFGMDASHRGGAPGFVAVVDERTLIIPDYAGNNLFNTVGNLVMDPRAGLLFVDFSTGGMLQLTGHTTIDWDSPLVAEFRGARRLIVFTLEEAIELPRALPLRFGEARDSIRSLRLVDKRAESDDVTSFVFEARDGGPLPSFEAGQHLPLELTIPGNGGNGVNGGNGGNGEGDRGGDAPVVRTYSLSNGPSTARYRLSVKREPRGLVSRYLHDALEPGALVGARSPAGDFVVEPGVRPLVLVSAGIGLTPLLSMLHALVESADPRPLWFLHGARDGRHHPFRDEVRELVRRHPGARLHVSYSRPRPEDWLGEDFDAVGRVDGALIERLVGQLDVDVYLCGPPTFMAAMQSELEARGVEPDRIHSESFGPRG
ncbi:MAG: pyridoxamine 5'-phosphate oxidase family protein [Myxococcota bacterium]